MNRKEEAAVRKHLRDVYGLWHQCRLGTRMNPIHKEDRARGLKRGQLCDLCEAEVEARIKDIKAVS